MLGSLLVDGQARLYRCPVRIAVWINPRTGLPGNWYGSVDSTAAGVTVPDGVQEVDLAGDGRFRVHCSPAEAIDWEGFKTRVNFHGAGDLPARVQQLLR